MEPPTNILYDITNSKEKSFSDISRTPSPPKKSNKKLAKKRGARIRETKTFTLKDFLSFMYAYTLDFYDYSAIQFPLERFIDTVGSKGSVNS